MEFQLILQRPNIQEDFNEQFLEWCQAIIQYCKETQTSCTAIQSIVKRVDVDEGNRQCACCVCAHAHTCVHTIIYLIVQSDFNSDCFIKECQSVSSIEATPNIMKKAYYTSYCVSMLQPHMNQTADYDLHV